MDIFTEEMDLGQGLTGYYTIEFDTNGEATADYGDANPVEAGLDFYVEMKRRGFAVPALDEVYGEQLQQRDERITELEHELETANEEINTLEGALAYSDGVFKTMVKEREEEARRISKIKQLSILLEAELKTIRDNGCDCVKNLKLPVGITEM